jgi:hypothetical protein
MIEHRIVIDQLGLLGPEDDKALMRVTAGAVTKSRTAAFIYESKSFWGDEEPAAAVIPADVARELIREGRLGLPPLASMTVLARDARP